MSSTSKFVLSLLGAAAAGAAIALLLAPEKGSDLRGKIRSTANDWADQLSDLVNTSKQKFDKVKTRAEDGLAEFKEKLS